MSTTVNFPQQGPSLQRSTSVSFPSSSSSSSSTSSVEPEKTPINIILVVLLVIALGALIFFIIYQGSTAEERALCEKKESIACVKFACNSTDPNPNTKPDCKRSAYRTGSDGVKYCSI